MEAAMAMGKRIVVALGGNAILSDDPSTEGQMKALRHTSKQLVELIKQGHELIISHGNGPQVGNLLLQQAIAQSDKNPALSLDTCVAMTQGSIGYWLQNTMNEAMVEAGLNKQVASVVTQVVVDENDQAFSNPTKPIGPFFSQGEAEKAAAENGETYVEDAGRGYRKVVPSPKPQTIVEYPMIKTLIENGYVTISAGGGGIPVKKVANGYEGVEAVIDKDFASAKLANLVEADYLFILTGVDNVYVNYNQPNQEKLEEVTVDQLNKWIDEEQFAPGSMLPKVEAAISFVEGRPGSKAVITSLENINSIFTGGSATVVQAGSAAETVN
jgi:carbamate kinase